MTFGECFCLESINVASSLQKGPSSVKLDLGFLWISVGSKFSVTFLSWLWIWTLTGL